MDEFPLAVLPMEDGSITEGHLSTIGQPKQCVAVDHPAQAALAVGSNLPGTICSIPPVASD